MSQGRGVCVCLNIWRYVVHTFTRETYLICIIHPWCSIFWYLDTKIRFYVLSFSISTSSFVLVVGIISCDKVFASLRVYIIFKSLCWLILPLYRLFFFIVSLPAKTSLGRGGWGKKEIPILLLEIVIHLSNFRAKKALFVVLNWFLWCHGPEDSILACGKNMGLISSRYLSILRGNLFFLFWGAE